MTLPEVDRLRRHQNAHPVRWKDHVPPPSARTISAIRPAGVAPSSRTATDPAMISIAEGAGSASSADGRLSASNSTSGANSASPSTVRVTRPEKSIR